MGPPSTPPTILHVDMDAFYASVEVLHEPGLAGRPVLVGGSGDRGVVASCSYEARVFGIRSAMPSAQARRLCPQAVFVRPAFERYAQYSRRIHAVFASFTPLVEGIALDEAFLDVTGARRLFGSGAYIAAAIRSRVARLGLTCSVGVGTSKLVAKLACEQAKPRVVGGRIDRGPGVAVVDPGRELAFLHRHPVDALWGVGPATGQRLRRLGIETVGDLATVPVQTLVAALGHAAGHHLHELSLGHDPRPVQPVRASKSVGNERTYEADLVEADELGLEAVRLADSVATRLRRAGLVGRTVTVKVRFSDFATISRSQTLPGPVDSGPELARVARSLLEGVDPTPGVRLLGISVSLLSAAAARQLTLEDGLVHSPAWSEAWAAVDQVRRRFGEAMVGPAAVVVRARGEAAVRGRSEA